mmetsp:Transcript_23544/g.76611  ORF Transcript_23544/g.76611 Transcript_23544/m.76611 type:complete len:296 (+) Transcript_23544:3291-4178(+)
MRLPSVKAFAIQGSSTEPPAMRDMSASSARGLASSLEPRSASTRISTPRACMRVCWFASVCARSLTHCAAARWAVGAPRRSSSKISCAGPVEMFTLTAASFMSEISRHRTPAASSFAVPVPLPRSLTSGAKPPARAMAYLMLSFTTLRLCNAEAACSLECTEPVSRRRTSGSTTTSAALATVASEAANEARAAAYSLTAVPVVCAAPAASASAQFWLSSWMSAGAASTPISRTSAVMVPASMSCTFVELARHWSAPAACSCTSGVHVCRSWTRNGKDLSWRSLSSACCSSDAPSS